MKKALFAFVLLVAGTVLGTPREQKYDITVNDEEDVKIYQKAYSASRWTFTLKGVDLSGYGTPTVGIKSALTNTAFWALGTGTVSAASAGRFYVDWAGSSWATNIATETTFYGDIRFSDFDVPLPSLDIRLKPSANWGNETYVAPANASWQTNGVSVGLPTVVNITTNLRGTVSAGVLEIWSTASGSGSGSQTPWTNNINAATYDLTNVTSLTVDNGDLILQSLGSQTVRFNTSGQVYDSSDLEIIDYTTHSLSSNAGVWEVEGSAVAGNDIVSWTVLTNQIATLAPTPARTGGTVYRQHLWDWETGTGPSGNNAGAFVEYASYTPTNNTLHGLSWVSVESTLQDSYVVLSCDMPAWASSIGADGIKIMVRSASTTTTDCKVDNVILSDTTNHSTNTADLASTTADVWDVTTLSYPSAWDATVPSRTVDGVAMYGFDIRAEVYSKDTNHVQFLVITDWD